MTQRQTYSTEFKTQAVALVQEGETVNAVARSLGLAHGTLWNWVAKARPADPKGAGSAGRVEDAIDPAAHQAALRRIAELEQENELLGKASAYFAQHAHRKP